MGSYVRVFEVLAVVVLITSASAGGPKFPDDFTIIVNFTEQYIFSSSPSFYGQDLFHISEVIYSNTKLNKLRTDLTFYILNSNQTSTTNEYELFDFTEKKVWTISEEEGKPPGKCMESSYKGPKIQPLNLDGLDVKYVGKFPGFAGLMFDTWVSDPYAHNDNKTLNYTILTTFNKAPATLSLFANEAFAGYIFKDYDPTPPNPSIFKLPPSCKNNTVLLNREYKRKFTDPFKYSFLRMHDFFQF